MKLNVAQALRLCPVALCALASACMAGWQGGLIGNQSERISAILDESALPPGEKFTDIRHLDENYSAMKGETVWLRGRIWIACGPSGRFLCEKGSRKYRYILSDVVYDTKKSNSKNCYFGPSGYLFINDRSLKLNISHDRSAFVSLRGRVVADKIQTPEKGVYTQIAEVSDYYIDSVDQVKLVSSRCKF